MNVRRSIFLATLLTALLLAAAPLAASADSHTTPSASAQTPPPVPKETRPLTITKPVSQKGQEKIPKKYRLATVTLTIVPTKKTSRHVTPADYNIRCYGEYPIGYRQYLDYHGIFGISLIHYEQDIYFCWSLDTFMLYGVPEVTPVVSSHWGWSYVGSYPPKLDWVPYPYIFHSYDLGAFDFSGQGLIFQKHVGLDAYCYWDGSCHAGPHYG